MISRHPNDDEIVTKLRRSNRVQARVLLLTAVLFAAEVAVLLGGTAFHMPSRLVGGIGLVLLLTWVAILFRNSDFVPPPEAYLDENIFRKMIDDHHRRWRWVFLSFFGLLVMQATQVTLNFLRASKVAFPMSSDTLLLLPLSAGVFAFLTLLTALQVCFGPGFFAGYYRRALNDELTRNQQRRAALFGYLLSIVAMSAVLIALMLRPQWGIAALPAAIAAAIILPGLYFLILQWRAGRNG